MFHCNGLEYSDLDSSFLKTFISLKTAKVDPTYHFPYAYFFFILLIVIAIKLKPKRWISLYIHML